ncbi:MAG: hypothetical protein K2L46_04460, partial [Paramuribaculum sp.]|nr:hypothetical protein [Paramuribaculum sp.]
HDYSHGHAVLQKRIYLIVIVMLWRDGQSFDQKKCRRNHPTWMSQRSDSGKPHKKESPVVQRIF